MEYDLVIIGRGAAAFSAAIRASEITSQEARIAMIGTGPLGGTCVNVGCVPSKYLLEASHRVYEQSHPKIKGIDAVHAKYSFSELMNGLREHVADSRKSKYMDVISNYPNVTVYDGTAKFVDGKRVQVKQLDRTEVISGTDILVATGSRPAVPNIEGLEKAGFLTSDSIWDINELPESIAIIGAGAIGLELGQAFLHLGSKITVIEALDSLLPQSEPEIGAALLNRLESEGMKFYLRSRISSVHSENGRKSVEVITSQGKMEIVAEQLLVAAGRIPNTSGLNIQAAGIETDPRGGIVTDSSMKTSAAGIYAAGDCVSKKMLLETLAAREGAIAAGNIFGQEGKIDYNSTAWAVFTNPQVAGVGLTEREYTMKNKSCSCRTFSLSNLTKAGITGETDGVIKITVEPSTGRVVGMHVFSPNATDIITEGAYAVKNGLTYEDIIDTSHIFPSYSEGIKLAAQSFIRDISKMSCCIE
ncbi:MAG: mercury(II) reductase [Nitrososphaeria archaeon]